MTRAMTLRLPAEQAAQLDAVARADQMTVSDTVRTAIEAHIEKRRQDPEFRASIQRIIAEQREVLELLAR